MIPKIEAYTVATDTPKEMLDKFSRIQFTLNSRIHPSKRRSVETVRKMREQFPKGEIFVHYDFVYIASRYMFLNEGTKKSVIRELRDLMDKSTGISGVVMHTDFPIRKEVLKFEKEDTVSITNSVNTLYNKSLFDKKVIIDSLTTMTCEQILSFNLEGFLHDLFAVSGWNFGCPLYLENTTKNANSAGTPLFLTEFVYRMQDKYPWVGLCYDTEHAFASVGFSDLSKQMEWLKPLNNVMIHLNPVPECVKPCSGKDRHSETTLFECSEYQMDYYFNIISFLNENNIPYIRECYQETIVREQEQWQQVQLNLHQ